MSIFDGIKPLGFGLMRMPILDENDDKTVDIEQVKQMTDLYIAKGFNYFDTALMYHGCVSENTVKDFLTSRYPRDTYKLATKLHYDFFEDKADADKVFAKQLEDTGVEYFDYYLIHDISERSYPKYVEHDIFNWAQDKKAQGLMKHVGFSYHDKAPFLDKVLTEHPEIEFVQLQINYLDWDSADIQSRDNYEVCVKHNKPVIVMEPVRGGKLAKLPPVANNILKNANPDISIASWAVRFCASLDNVKLVLSGMSSLEQMEDNLSYMENFQPLTEEELELVFKAKSAIDDSSLISCTECSYCTEGCPQKICIPKYFALYNKDVLEELEEAWEPQMVKYAELNQSFGKASDCIECGKCDEICPQHLPITTLLKDVAAHFE